MQSPQRTLGFSQTPWTHSLRHAGAYPARPDRAFSHRTAWTSGRPANSRRNSATFSPEVIGGAASGSAAAAPVTTPLVVARESAPPSYTTPVDDSPGRRTAPLFNYVAAHSDVAASPVRLAPLSSVMGGGFDLTQDAVEMTAAEVGARR